MQFLCPGHDPQTFPGMFSWKSVLTVSLLRATVMSPALFLHDPMVSCRLTLLPEPSIYFLPCVGMYLFGSSQ